MSKTVEGGEGAYADDTPLVELFGGARARILSTLITKRSREFTISELARQAGVSRNSVYDNIDDFEQLGIVERVAVAQGSRYRAADTEVAQKLHELNGATLKRLLEADAT